MGASPKPPPEPDFSRFLAVAGARVLITSGEGDAGADHVAMWIDTLEDSRVPFAVLTRNSRLYDKIACAYPKLSVAFAPAAGHVDRLLASAPKLQCILYTSNTSNNFSLLAKDGYRHIFVGHGDSNKSASAHKFFRVFDEVWVAGQAHADRFRVAGLDVGGLEFLKVGRPNLRDVAIRSRLCWRDRLPKPTLLYMPTWEGILAEQDYTSLHAGEKFLDIALTMLHADCVIKLHPSTGRRRSSLTRVDAQIASELRSKGHDVRLLERSERLRDVLPCGNIYFADISAIVSECLAADAPIFIFKPANAHLRMSDALMPLSHFAYVFSNPAELKDHLETFLSQGDNLAAGRQEAREYFLGINETLSQTFGEALRLRARS